MKKPNSAKWLKWYQTFSGRRFNPLNATPDDIYIEDIAHSLSLICRFGGHCKHFYSVGQHSILCAQHVPPEYQFQALMHDATEAYIGDMVTPLKNQMPKFHQVEDRLWKIIAKKFQLPRELANEVKVADRQALGTERRDLLDNREHHPWKILKGIKIWPETISPWSPLATEAKFLQSFHYLYPLHLSHLDLEG